MNISNQRLDWNAPDILMQIVNNIEVPLTTIMEANNGREIQKNRTQTSDIIFSNTKQISEIIKEVFTIAKSSSIRILDTSEPKIFSIYTNTPRLQSFFTSSITPDHMSSSEKKWLLDFEKEVFKRISDNVLNLGDLAYCMAVSERQLHRKITNLLHLSPNKYIRILKMQKAKELLDDYSYDTVSEVSYAVGYQNAHYFSKLFFQHYGESPKTFLVKDK